MKFSYLYFFFLILILSNFVYAITWNRPTIVEATLNVNSSEIWVTAEGDMDNVTDLFPALNGTFVTYIDAIANVDLGSKSLTTTSTGRFDSGIIDSSSDLSVDGESRYLYYSDGSTISVDWGSGDLNDASGNQAVDYGARQLIATGGIDTILDFSTAETAEFDDTNIITTGNISINSNSSMLKVGVNDDIQIYHNGSESYIDNTHVYSGDLYIRNLDYRKDVHIGGNYAGTYADMMSMDVSAQQTHVTGQFFVEDDTYPVFKGTRTSTSATGLATAWQCKAKTTADSTTFGASFLFVAEDNDNVSNNLGGLGVSRYLHDGSGLMKFIVYNEGAYTNPLLIYPDGTTRLIYDNQKLTFGAGGTGDASISYDGTNMIFISNETGSGLAWFSRNVSAEGFMTRTSVYDKQRGSALDFIKDADDYKLFGEIDHSKFYGYTSYDVTDFSKNETRITCYFDETLEGGKEVCRNETYYPYKKTEEAISLNAEVDVLRQAVYEQQQIIEDLERRIEILEK